jgi:hypothetical protein
VPYYPGFTPDPEVCKRYAYGREPYVRITLEDGSTVDGKAHAWQGDRFLANWFDDDGNQHSLWMDNRHALRLPYRESQWHDSPSAEDIPWRIEQGEM